ncbi:radical SAM protein [Kiritimatiellota bacterium B12222]|nr:radical SAM protein [Kiritimatiellota bacterium B12222]
MRRKENNKATHGVGEWASHSVNIQSGCEKNCKYCYAKSMAIRFGRKTPSNWNKKPDLNEKAIGKGYRKREGRIMYPTSHDITPRNIEEYLTVLLKLLESGNEVLIVSKPTLPCIKRICEECEAYKDQILFRFTIGSANDSVLKFWEPGAPMFQHRLDCLKLAYKNGFATSVSSEPMLDNRIDKVVTKTMPYVTDAIWLGRVNQLRQALSINCPKDNVAKKRGDELLAKQTDTYLSELYESYKDDPKVKYKDSIKEAVGLERPETVGLDI